MPSHSFQNHDLPESGEAWRLRDKALNSRANVLTGYAFVGAWLGGIVGLLGIQLWVSPAYLSMATGLLGGVVGLLRLRKTAS